MNLLHILCLVCPLAFVQATLPFKFGDCSTATANKIGFIDHVSLSADPIHIPGDETASLQIHVLRPIDGSYTVKVRVQKKLLFGFVEVPCSNVTDLGSIGSCSYKLCDLLTSLPFNGSNHCPLEIAQTSPDFQCECPFQVAVYTLNPTTFHLPPITGVMQWLAMGDYKAEARIFDDATGEEVGCSFVHASMNAECTGPACIFGRK